MSRTVIFSEFLSFSSTKSFKYRYNRAKHTEGFFKKVADFVKNHLSPDYSLVTLSLRGNQNLDLKSNSN